MRKRLAVSWVVASFMFLVVTGWGKASAADLQFDQVEPEVSADGRISAKFRAPRILVDDPRPEAQGIWEPVEMSVAPEAATATFKWTFIAAGGKDPWGKVCQAFPTAAKAAMIRAGAIWGTKLKSPVPIHIKACWANLGSPVVLGYSGALWYARDYAGLPRRNTWYAMALANSLLGRDLVPKDADDGITINSGFSWYLGTDGRPPAGQHDLVSVAMHEIAHGLHFSGSAFCYGGKGYVGWKPSRTSYASPEIYDRFMESGSGKLLLSYANPSAALCQLLTSNNLWFDAPWSKAANGGRRVKMFAPAGWMGGSSYSHLDYTTFKDSKNNLMVYAIGSGSSRQVIGPVVQKLLKDLGWKLP